MCKQKHKAYDIFHKKMSSFCFHTIGFYVDSIQIDDMSRLDLTLDWHLHSRR